jgi:hypothetical protein
MEPIMFDASSFLSASLPTNSTETIPIPVGLYPATILEVAIKDGLSGPNSKKPGTPWVRLDVTWEIDDDHVRELLHRSKVSITQGIMLDLGPDGKPSMEEGQNVGLGRLRKACNCNDGNETLLALVGRYAKIDISHEIYLGAVKSNVKSVVSI